MRRITMVVATLVATLVAAPVVAQTTGTIQAFNGSDFTFPATATLNGNREWEVTYSADISAAIKQQRFNCNNTEAISGSCDINPPYIMRYGVWTQGKAACVFSDPPPPQSAINGINGWLTLTAWSQTLRTDPDTGYCIAIYAGESNSYFHNFPIARSWFQTPPDPNPPSTPWAPTPGSSGCFAETSPSLVQSCLNCKYVQTDRRWDGNADQCVSANS